MQGALLLVWAALLPADLALSPRLTAGASSSAHTHTVGGLNEIITIDTTSDNVVSAQGNVSNQYSFSDERTTSSLNSSNNNFMPLHDTLGQKYMVQVPPISVDQLPSDIPDQVSTISRTTVEPKVWTDEVWPNTETAHSYTITSRNKNISIKEISDESGFFNGTFEGVILPGPVQVPEYSHDLVADSSEPVVQASVNVPSWMEYSSVKSARAEKQQFAASLKSLMRGGSNKTGKTEREQDVDLVLSGERALVRLWPQFGDLLEQLLQLASDSCKSIPLVPLISQYQGTETPNMKMIMFTSRGKRELRAGESIPRTADMVVVYVPGWWNTPSDSAARALRDALVPAAGALLVLDTRAAFCRPYLSAAARVQLVADYLARWVLHCGLEPARLHLLGFSLGAHVAALAALRVRAAAGQRLGRVSALEPAAPCLTAGGWRRGANHVQVLHTSRSLALRRPLGHADVYAAVQCAPACQHAAAWRLFAASARDPAALTAPRCLRPRDLAAGNCRGHNATLGFRCAPDARGVFFLQTHHTAL